MPTKQKSMTLAQAVQVSGLSEAQVKAVQVAARATWDAIGYDCLEANGEKTMLRAQVVELIIDADHLSTYGNHGSARETGPLADPAVVAFVRNQPWTAARSDALHAIVAAALPFGRYGM